MKSELAGLTALTIAGAGVTIAIAGLLVWYSREPLASLMRYVLPIPPLGVAAYVFVFNLLRERPEQLSIAAQAREIAFGSVIAALVFASFAVGILVFVRLWR